MTQLSPERFSTDFGSLFQRTAFRLERLDYYVAANEREPYSRFLAGEPQDPAWREPWKTFVRSAIASGKQMARVHVVTEPLGDYLRFELTCAYPANVAAGEDVRILRSRDYRGLWLPDHDFWLFDDAVAQLDYDADGNWVGVSLTSDPGALWSYRQVRAKTLAESIPLHDYLGSLGLREAV